MRKITSLLSIALMAAFAMNAQVDRVEIGETTSYSYNNIMADCSFEHPRDNLYGGAINSTKYASRFTVPQNETFQATDVTMIVGAYNDPTYTVDQAEFEFVFYEDFGTTGPGSALTSVVVEPTSATFIEDISLTSGALVSLYEIVVDLSGLDPIQSSSGASTDYFFGISMVDDDGIQVGVNFTQAATGSITFYIDDSTGDWAPFNAADPENLSFTYVLNGQCDVLSINSQVLSQVGVYPNPTTGILNIQTPSNVTVDSVAVFDILGKKVNADYSNNAIDMTSLSQGIYLLKVETSAGVLTQKIVKQ